MTRGQSGVWERRASGLRAHAGGDGELPELSRHCAPVRPPQWFLEKRRSGHASSVWQSVPNGLCCRLPLYCWHHCWCLAVPLQALRQRSAQPLQGPEGAVSHPAETVSRQEAAASAFSRRGIRSETVQIRSLMGTSFTYCEAGRTFGRSRGPRYGRAFRSGCHNRPGDRVEFFEAECGGFGPVGVFGKPALK